jgi:hypothetical protein
LTDTPKATVTALRGGADPRCETLLKAIRAVLNERGCGLPMPLVIGVLRILEHELLAEQRDA